MNTDILRTNFLVQQEVKQLGRIHSIEKKIVRHLNVSRDKQFSPCNTL